ncbi:orotidine-5'-phosphate decarboxylase [Candidatus Uhrbacteria bacterium]|nr:orotidine-5'-phosphate decarboxylase [Candidatus Uhrbacteria bacterium]
METLTSVQKILRAMQEKNSLLCVGFDPEPEKLPIFLLNEMHQRYDDPDEAMAQTMKEFIVPILEAVAPYASTVKPQSAFYERYGHHSIRVLEQIIKRAHELGLPVILDAKRGDGGPTAEAYADAYLGKNSYWDVATQSFIRKEGPLHVEALTIQPGIGDACLVPFIARAKEYGTCPLIVTKSSFTPNSFVEMIETDDGRVWQQIAQHIAELSNELPEYDGYKNIGVVMGATYPDDAPFMRQVLKSALFLVPGYGAQGGGADEAVFGIDPQGLGCVINSSRGILYAYLAEEFKKKYDDYDRHFVLAAATAAMHARDDLNAALSRKLSARV